jgi:putative peptide zinc metalloprotease protein
VWWLAAGDMITALFAGNPAEILLGLYVIVPVALAALFSGIGLSFEFITKPAAVEHDN